MLKYALPDPKPLFISGAGDSVVDLPPKWKGGKPAVLHIIGPQIRDIFSIWNYDSNREKINLLVNTIGPYDGYVPMDFIANQETKRFEIKAGGDWSIEVLPLTPKRYSRTLRVPGAYQGRGDDVVMLTGRDPDLASVESSSPGNFSIWSYGEHPDLLVNVIGPYRGTVVVPAAANLLVVTSEGEWTIKISST